jgi:hypothetical protein
VENENMTSIACECGCIVHKSSLARHKRTAKHNNLMRPVPVPVVEVNNPAVEMVKIDYAKDLVKLIDVLNERIKFQEDQVLKLKDIIDIQTVRITKLEDIINNKVVDVVEAEPVVDVVEVEPVVEVVKDEPVIDEDDDEDDDENDDEDDVEMNQSDYDEEEEEEEYLNDYNDIAERMYNMTLRANYKGVDVKKYENQKYLHNYLYIDIHKILDKHFKELWKAGTWYKDSNKIFKIWEEQMYKTLDEYIKEYPIKNKK